MRHDLEKSASIQPSAEAYAADQPIPGAEDSLTMKINKGEQRSKILPFRSVHKSDPAISQILRIPLHRNGARAGPSAYSRYHREKKEEVQMKIEPGESNVDGHRIDVNAAD
ncbi:hypothetical protein PPTG_15484 [Phytophthora nicotianae INRA-310]|uniref:Uncharacterized protein n=1 Tax=Phytophthora nicotianae (strain INRA-310) TaxID=761204 RepID=W2PR67_PHYN3|nr:hypothetical protein PPTG_15484 [Phytophthora nicotianae INRA-310]ETN02729.1 hypothetical protein PPTG_15484 [Phytophthora nicotianae INRA-310]